MKNFCQTLIFISLFSAALKIFLPKGEKSPLYPPLKFLLSLALILCVFSPIINLKENKNFSFDIDLSAKQSYFSGEELIFTRMEEVMREAVKTAFPNTDFSLMIYRNDKGLPSMVGVICEKEVAAKEIADFINSNYQIQTKVI